MNFRRPAAWLGLASALACQAAWTQKPPSPDACSEPVRARQTYRALGELLLELTRKQLHQGVDAKYLVGQKALERDWSPEQEQQFLRDYFDSAAYTALQKEREPYTATLEAMKSRWQRTQDDALIQDLCRFAPEASAALKASHLINLKEQEALLKALDAAP